MTLDQESGLAKEIHPRHGLLGSRAMRSANGGSRWDDGDGRMECLACQLGS